MTVRHMFTEWKLQAQQQHVLPQQRAGIVLVKIKMKIVFFISVSKFENASGSIYGKQYYENNTKNASGRLTENFQKMEYHIFILFHIIT